MSSTVVVSDAIKQAIVERAGRAGRPIARIADELLTAGLSGPTVPIGPTAANGTGEPTLAQAAEIFLRHLPEPMVELIRELCRSEQHQPYQYLLSYMKLAYDRAETAFFMSEDDLTTHAARAGQATPQLSPRPCEFCHNPFTPIRIGQKFCPDVDNGEPSCGQKAAQLLVQATRPRVAGAQHTRAIEGLTLA